MHNKKNKTKRKEKEKEKKSITRPFRLFSPGKAHRGIKCNKNLLGFSAQHTKY